LVCYRYYCCVGRTYTTVNILRTAPVNMLHQRIKNTSNSERRLDNTRSIVAHICDARAVLDLDHILCNLDILTFDFDHKLAILLKLGRVFLAVALREFKQFRLDGLGVFLELGPKHLLVNVNLPDLLRERLGERLPHDEILP